MPKRLAMWQWHGGDIEWETPPKMQSAPWSQSKPFPKGIRGINEASRGA